MADEETSDNQEEQQQEKQLILKLYKYHIETFEVHIDGLEKPITLGKNNVLGMIIEEEYDKAFMPLFQMKCAINPALHEFIILNKYNVKFRIRLQCDIMNAEGEVESKKDVFNEFFIPLIGDERPFYDFKLYEETVKNLNATNGTEVKNDDQSQDNFVGDAKKEVTFFLYKQDDLINSKEPVNEVFSGNDMNNIVCSVVSDIGFKVLMSPCDNNGDFSQVIIPMMNLISMFKYLEENYKLYSAGALVYFGFRCLYILDKNGHPNCYEPEEYKKTIFSIHPTKSSEHLTPGTFSIEEDKEYHIYCEPNRVQMMNFSVYNDHIYGNNLMMVDSNNNTTNTMSGAGNQKGDGVFRIAQDTYSNDYARKIYMNKVADNNLRLKTTVFDIDLDAITPNKEFIFNFVDSRIRSAYSGYYRISSTVLAFAKSGDFFTVSAQCEFIKKEDLTEVEKTAIDAKVAADVKFGSKTSTTTNESDSTEAPAEETPQENDYPEEEAQ